MTRGGLIGSIVLLACVGAVGIGLTLWKRSTIRAAAEAGAPPEMPYAISVASVAEQPYFRTTTAIGTVLAMQSIALRNEIPGTVRQVALAPGKIVEEGELLVGLDVSVEEAELSANEAQAKLADTLLVRIKTMSESLAASATELDRARAERDVALANISRAKAIIARRTIRAPFRARVGISDVHVGQYLLEGTLITTLQSVNDSAHVDFTVAQRYAGRVQPGDKVEVFVQGSDRPLEATVVAVDARVDPATRNAMIRAKIPLGPGAPAPGSSVRVRVPIGTKQNTVFIPVNALRKGPSGDHVFIIAKDEKGETRAKVRPVESGEMIGDLVLIRKGLVSGEQVATAGSFKLRESVLVAVAPDDSTTKPSAGQPAVTQASTQPNAAQPTADAK